MFFNSSDVIVPVAAGVGGVVVVLIIVVGICCWKRRRFAGPKHLSPISDVVSVGQLAKNLSHSIFTVFTVSIRTNRHGQTV